MAAPLIAAAVIAPVIGGIMGNMMGRSERKRAEQALREAMAQFEGMNVPDEEKLRLALESPEVKGIFQPYMEQVEQLGPSAMEDIQIDPRLRQAQMQALDTLGKMGSEGLTAEDRMMLNASRRQVAGDVQAQQASILQNLAQRGASGGGLELAARLQASQEGGDRASQESDRLMAMAQRRMLEGVASAGQLGGQIRGQEFGEQSEASRAKDAIAQFNLQQRAGVGQRNIAGLNQAQLRNLQEEQRIHESGVHTRNQMEASRAQAAQQNYENQMRLAQARAAALGGKAQHHQGESARIGEMYTGIGRGAGQIAGSFVNNKNSKAVVDDELDYDYGDEDNEIVNTLGKK